MLTSRGALVVGHETSGESMGLKDQNTTRSPWRRVKERNRRRELGWSNFDRETLAFVSAPEELQRGGLWLAEGRSIKERGLPIGRVLNVGGPSVIDRLRRGFEPSISISALQETTLISLFVGEQKWRIFDLFNFNLFTWIGKQLITETDVKACVFIGFHFTKLHL